jgi:PIN domain nuclease of toxin-antitoxin system
MVSGDRAGPYLAAGLAVARAIAKLDFESDPADEIIAATSLVHRVPLVTRDRRIRRSKRVPLAK